MLIDDVTIRVKAGNGGRGAVAFNKNAMSLGPVGGDGGDGGNVFIEGVADLGALKQFRHKKGVVAKNGANGKGQFNDGEKGEDAVIHVPVGTVVHINTHTREIVKIGERILIAKGGMGGKGNFKFRSPRNTSPRRFQPGTPGEEHVSVRLELKLIADVGLIGLPNVGKSSLLNALTSAKSRVANYAFTTLEPHLGVYYELILADIPGLIEGASSGKGLGVKFLKHVERTRTLFHLISAESEDPVRDYLTVRHELIAYNKILGEKEEYVFLSKSDECNADTLKKKITALCKVAKRVEPLSIIDDRHMKKIENILTEIINGKISLQNS